MKRILTWVFCAALLAGCQKWTGITTTQLAKKMGGPPQRIQNSGDYRVYVYRDPMGGGQLSFFVDKQGIVRKWTGATVNGGFNGDGGDAAATDGGAAQN